MHTCSNCGTEFDTKYLQCPNCGCTRGDIKDAEKHDKRTERIGGIIAIFFVIFLIGLITYGGYLLMNPIKDGPINSSIQSTTTITTAETTTLTTTPKVVGTPLQFGRHTLTIPEGFYQTEGTINYTPISIYNFGNNCIWISNNTNTYMLTIMDKTSFKYNDKTEEAIVIKNQINAELVGQGFSEIKSNRYAGRLFYYSTRSIDGYNYTVQIFYNRYSYLIMSSYTIVGSELTNENTADIIKIISTIE